MKKRFITGILCAALLVPLFAGAGGGSAQAADIPVYNDIPAYQQKDMIDYPRVPVGGIDVEEVVNATVSPAATSPIMEPVQFVIYNTTLQHAESTVTSENGELPVLQLVDNHNYIIFAQDPNYRMTNVYIWVKNGVPVDIKKGGDPFDYPIVESLELYRRSAPEEDPASDRRVMINLPVMYGSGNRYNVKFKLISEVDTVEATSGNNGMLRAELLEDVTYMVTVDDPTFDVEPLPLTVKDKSEYGLAKYTYNHSNCRQVTQIDLVKKEDAHKNDTTLVSLSGNTRVEGMNFSDYLLLDDELGVHSPDPLPDMDVYDIKLVNPHRWEVSKLAAGQFKVTKKVDPNKLVTRVCYDGLEKELEFEQSGDLITFTMSDMSLSPIRVEYSESEPGPEALPYEDVNFTDWHYNAVDYAYRNGIMTGINPTTFAPNDPLARAQFAVILHRLNGTPAMDYADRFHDVGAGIWYTDAILWAADTDVVTGYSNGNFGPSDYINREQMALMMYRYAGYKGYDTSARADFGSYQDAANVSDFAEEAMQWAVGEGIITGKYQETQLDPQGNATRAECATIMMRFMEKYGA